MIREGKNTNDVMVNIVTARYDVELMQKLADKLRMEFPAITSLVNNITTRKAAVAFGEHEELLAGTSTIREHLGTFEFEISANSFFQTNTRQAEHLYDIALEFAELDGKELVYDLYCGAGAIAIFAAAKARQVIGFEVIPSAIMDANRNLEINHIKNCCFVEIDLMNMLANIGDIIKEYGQPDVIIIDPPRSGMHPKTVQAISKINPDRIVHVSCNPATLARDLEILCKEQYRLTKVQPLDMFPHTAHIEVVAQLKKVN